ncbi:hypothetical protein P171DRAFT_444381 [Karstenula rhodostoma CBS 690.94]|uniref:Uncharacterized protein n=1 Tax=Karstenula rhodostoma CBS 690.94 TaxID=1392251 RepID=A0A9P4PHQ7_9PLEO|nr:hypothetical protein P171DRAFT_444381 [Karstenula rhodostoma CBS 690.94]
MQSSKAYGPTPFICSEGLIALRAIDTTIGKSPALRPVHAAKVQGELQGDDLRRRQSSSACFYSQFTLSAFGQGDCATILRAAEGCLRSAPRVLTFTWSFRQHRRGQPALKLAPQPQIQAPIPIQRLQQASSSSTAQSHDGRLTPRGSISISTTFLPNGRAVGDVRSANDLREKYGRIRDRYGRGVDSPGARGSSELLAVVMESITSKHAERGALHPTDDNKFAESGVSDVATSAGEYTTDDKTAEWLSQFLSDLQQHAYQHGADPSPASKETAIPASKQSDYESSSLRIKRQRRRRADSPRPRKASVTACDALSKNSLFNAPSHREASASRAAPRPSKPPPSTLQPPPPPTPEFAVWVGSFRYTFDDENAAEIFRRQQDDMEEQDRIAIEAEAEKARARRRESDRVLMERIWKIKNQRRMW